MEPNGHGERPISVLVSDAATQLSQLARQEMDLARLEIREDVAAATTGAAGFGLAGGAALVGVVFLALAAMFGIATWLPMWVSAAIVGGASLLAAAVFAMVGRRAMVRVGPPERTVRTLKEDVECLRHPTN
jgi:hypothetical protein